MFANDFDIPVMYQDLGNYSMNPFATSPMVGGMMPGMVGGIGANTSYLGGVTMTPQPDRDIVQLINKKDNEGKNTLKKVGLALGVLFLMGFIPHFRKQICKSGGLKSYLNKLFSSTKNNTKNVSKPKGSIWQKFKNFFKAKPFSSTKNNTKNVSKPKGSRWQKFKNFFKAKP